MCCEVVNQDLRILFVSRKKEQKIKELKIVAYNKERNNLYNKIVCISRLTKNTTTRNTYCQKLNFQFDEV